MLLGIDIGGTSIKVGLFDTELSLIKNYSFPSNSFDDSSKFFEFLNQDISTISDAYSVEAIGIGIPGLLSKDFILEKSPNLKFLEGVNLAENLLNKLTVPAVIENDANMAAMSELIGQSEENIDNFVYLTIGTGVGGSIIIEGKPFHGDAGFAGEIGHIIIDSKFDENSDVYRIGTLESKCGKQGIVDFYNSLTGSNEAIGVKDISKLAENGDAIAVKTLDHTAFHLASGIISIIHALNICKIVIGGGISNSNYLLQKTTKYVNKRVMYGNKELISIKRAKHNEDSGIYGAAYCAKSKLLSIKQKEKI
ncbi:MAG: ROK family protein [Candidatus Kapabacteria bacterium]|nr:ROK family protein [Candidatus Kapabacteria bacterium]